MLETVGFWAGERMEEYSCKIGSQLTHERMNIKFNHFAENFKFVFVKKADKATMTDFKQTLLDMGLVVGLLMLL